VLPPAIESRHGFHSDIRSFVERAAEDPRADGWEGDDPTAMFFGELKG